MTYQAAKEQALREEFEKWAIQKMSGILYPGSWIVYGGEERTGYYCHSATAWTWAAWQAARASSPVATTWISVDDRLPEVGTDCIVWCREIIPGFGPFAKVDRWDEQREAPVSFSSATVPIGPGWDDSELDEVTHWMPLPQVPGVSAPPSPGAAQGMEPVAWMVKQTFTEFFTDLEEACKYAMTIGATVVPLYASPPASPAPAREAQLEAALRKMLEAHPYANDGRDGFRVLVTREQVEACREARAALSPSSPGAQTKGGV